MKKTSKKAKAAAAATVKIIEAIEAVYVPRVIFRPVVTLSDLAEVLKDL